MTQPNQPVVPLGTVVTATPSGLGEPDDPETAFTGNVDVPDFDGVPSSVTGPLEGFPVQITATTGYFKHIVDGYDVDPATITAAAPPGPATVEQPSLF